MPKTIGIVLLPDATTAAYVAQLGKGVLQNQISFPESSAHLSLLHLVVSARVLPQVKQAVRKLRHSGSLPFHCHELSYRSNGWCFIEVIKSQRMANMQQQVLPLAALRAEDTPFQWRTRATEGQLRSYKKYGYPNVGKAWGTHFTFGFTEARPLSRRKPIEKRGRFEKVAVAEIDEHGAAVKILLEVPL